MTLVQTTLFDRIDMVPLPASRRTGPSTSAAAAASMHQVAGAHCAAILAALRQAIEPLTSEAIGDRCGLTGVQVARRIAGLLRAGAIAVADDLGTTSTGRACQRYRACGHPNELDPGAGNHARGHSTASVGAAGVRSTAAASRPEVVSHSLRVPKQPALEGRFSHDQCSVGV